MASHLGRFVDEPVASGGPHGRRFGRAGGAGWNGKGAQACWDGICIGSFWLLR